MAAFLKFALTTFVMTCALVVLLVTARTMHDRKIDYRVSLEGVEVPRFESQDINFKHEYDETHALPFMASAIIDSNNDGREELFVGGGYNQPDALFRYDSGKFINSIDPTAFKKSDKDPSYGAISLDVDKNGFADLIVARKSGVWLYRNQNGSFKGEKLNIQLPDQSIPLSLAIADINDDGHFDLYISGYKEGEEEGTSGLFINQGDDTFNDVTQAFGVDRKHDTLHGMFIDLDGDQKEDLVVAESMGGVHIWKNSGQSQFESKHNPNEGKLSHPVGITVTDYDNDGKMDLFFTNLGTTQPRFLHNNKLAEGQEYHSKWMLFHNDGNFTFSDIAHDAKLADYEEASGAVLEDFNLDGRDDLVVSQNNINFFLHKIPFLRLPGRFFLMNEKGEFGEASMDAGVENKRYGFTPITADFNEDGHPDFVHINLDGKPKAFINGGTGNHYLKIKLPNTVESVGAVVTVTTEEGKKIHRPFLVGEGFCSDQSHILIFGLKKSRAVEVVVRYLSGKTENLKGLWKNTALTFN